MQQVIMAIHLMVVTALVALVLYQKSEGGALGIGQSGLFSGRGQANALTRATGILATIFFLTSIALTVLPAWERRQAGGDDWTKALDQKLTIKEIKPPVQAAPEGDKGKAASEESDSIFDQLRRAQEKRQAAPQSAPAVPAAPAQPKAETAPVAPQPATSAEEPKIETAPVAPQSAAPAEPKAETEQKSEPGLQASKSWASPRD